MAYVTLPSWDAMNDDEQTAAAWAWENGKLDFMVMPHQEQLWAIICKHVGLETDVVIADKYKEILSHTSPMKPLILEVARRFGKTSMYLLAIMALCMTNKDHTYYYTAPTEGDADDIFDDVAPSLLATCPPDMRPARKKMTYTFSTGSRIKIGGTFHGAEGLRGRAANGIGVDEAGTIVLHSPVSCLTYVVSSILLPQLSTTGGWSMMMTTPPPNMQHDYYAFAKSAMTEGRFIRMTIEENTAFSKEEIQTIKEASYTADPTGSAYDREFLCIARPDVNTLIVPLYTQEKLVTETWDKPEYYVHLHKYICLDHGTVDLNAVLFASYDYPNAKLRVEKELVLRNGPSTPQIAKAIKETRAEVFGEAKIERAICDSISQQIRIDLNDEFDDLTFAAPGKTILLSDNSGREGMV